MPTLGSGRCRPWSNVVGALQCSTVICTGAHASANTIVPYDVAWELVLTVPLPEDRGRRGDARPKVHRFRSLLLELGRRLRMFRARYGLTQDEVARVVGASDGTAVTQ